jgi:CubicO group peptidase (beta-lactamase class C family)
MSTLNTATPEAAGFSSARLIRVDQAMQRYVDEGTLAGIVTAVARRGRLVHMEKYGLMDVEAGKPMQLDTIFRIYSMTKPITSVAVMMLYEEGRFFLSDPVSKFIPAFEDVKVFVRKTETGLDLADLERPITIRDLLTHTSGLTYGFEEASYVDEQYRKHIWQHVEQKSGATLEEVVLSVARIPLVHQPGSAWTYGVSTDVLGYLVQVVSGMPFDQFLKERVTGPLGMVDTDFWVPEPKIERFATNYVPGDDGGLRVFDEPQTSQFAKPTTFPSGGGGMVSTASDYLRFAQMLLNKGELDGVHLLGRKTVELMTMNHLPPELHPLEDKAAGFGLGGAVVLDVARTQHVGSVGTWSWGGAASTRFWIDYQEELVGVLMVQLMHNDRYPAGTEFQVAVYQALVD